MSYIAMFSQDQATGRVIAHLKMEGVHVEYSDLGTHWDVSAESMRNVVRRAISRVNMAQRSTMSESTEDRATERRILQEFYRVEAALKMAWILLAKATYVSDEAVLHIVKTVKQAEVCVAQAIKVIEKRPVADNEDYETMKNRDLAALRLHSEGLENLE